MGDSKYSKLLTVILIIVVVGVGILLGFLGFDVYKKFTTKKEVAQLADAAKQKAGQAADKVNEAAKKLS